MSKHWGVHKLHAASIAITAACNTGYNDCSARLLIAKSSVREAPVTRDGPVVIADQAQNMPSPSSSHDARCSGMFGATVLAHVEHYAVADDVVGAGHASN